MYITYITGRAKSATQHEGKDRRQKDHFGLYGQVTKRTRWMPWQSEAMKDVVICDKSWGADKQALIQEFPNGETHSHK